MGGLEALSSAVAQAFARVSKDIGQVSEGSLGHNRTVREGYKGVEAFCCQSAFQAIKVGDGDLESEKATSMGASSTRSKV
jgi:hypothetical protein